MRGPPPWPSPPSSPPELTGPSACRCPPTAADASKLWRRRSGRTTSKLRYKHSKQNKQQREFTHRLAADRKVFLSYGRVTQLDLQTARVRVDLYLCGIQVFSSVCRRFTYRYMSFAKEDVLHILNTDTLQILVLHSKSIIGRNNI